MGHFHHHGRFEQRIFKRENNKSEQTTASTSVISPLIDGPLSKPDEKTFIEQITKRISSEHNEFIYVDPPKDLYIDKKNYVKIKQSRNLGDDDMNVDPILTDLLNKKDLTRPIYLILSEWGNPPFGGGECWLIDTAKWMCECGFASYYIYFNDPFKGHDFDKYEVETTSTCVFIRFPRNILQLIKFVNLLNPSLISHQGPRRMEHLRTAKLLEKPFITGFCFWQDLIKTDEGKPGDIFNQYMLQKALVPDKNFEWIYQQVSNCYVAGQFMLEIVERLHHVTIPVINTISDESQYKITRDTDGSPCENLYVTIVNICGLKGGSILR